MILCGLGQLKGLDGAFLVETDPSRCAREVREDAGRDLADGRGVLSGTV